VEVDPAVVSVLASVEAHGSPPGSDELVCALIVPLDLSRGPGGACIRINRAALPRPSAAPENTGASERGLEAELNRVEESSLAGT